jgi:putative sigma-54 modulation protein
MSRSPGRAQATSEGTMVDLHISGVHYDISDKVKTYVTEKLGSLAKYHAGLQKVHVTIHTQEKNQYRVDVDMHLPHGKDVVAHDAEATVYSAIDAVHDKAAAQLRKIHDKEARSYRVAV